VFVVDINQLSNKIIGAAIEVHKVLAPGLLESAYEECLWHELELRGLHYERQNPYQWCIRGENWIVDTGWMWWSKM